MSDNATASDDYLEGTSGADTISALEGDDNLIGGGGPDELRGGLGNDTIIVDDASAGTVVDGGDGIDRLEFGGSSNVAIDLADGALTIGDDLGAVTLIGIENALGGSGDDTIMGEAGANGLSGSDGADSLGGGDGNDTLRGGAGEDTLHGGSDADVAVFTGNQADYTVSYGQDERGFYTLVAHDSPVENEGVDKLYDVEALEFADATSTICFMPGTLVATPAGDVPVETLERGDLVLTAEGRAAPIVWMGRQTVSRRFADPLRVLPVRIGAGALGEGLPRRDLLVSPDHALFLDGVLVHAGALVNGSTIRQETEVPERWTYWHVELANHALVLAEGVPAESFVDNAERLAFDNWAEHQTLYPDGRPSLEMPFPRAKSRRQVPLSLRRRLAALAEGEPSVAVA